MLDLMLLAQFFTSLVLETLLSCCLMKSKQSARKRTVSVRSMMVAMLDLPWR